MIRDYVTALGGAIFLCAVIEMILPEGAFSKYVRLAMGLIVMSVMASPLAALPSVPPMPTLEAADFDIAAAEASLDARILARHRENLERAAKEAIGGSGEVYVEVAPDASITHVTVRLKERDEDAAWRIKNTLCVSEEKIEVIYEATQ